MRAHSLTGLLVLVALSSVACSMSDSDSGFSGAPAGKMANGGSSGYGGDSTASQIPAPGRGLPGEKHAEVTENDFIATADEPTSTFGVDVDTASYSLLRRDIDSGRLPAPAGVRPEEYVNYFHYTYPQPTDGRPFSVSIDAAPSRFGEGLHLVRVGLQGKTVDASNRKPVNLVFLVDTSGSMSAPNKLPLVKYSLTKLIDQLRPTDTLAIVTYAGAAQTLLEPTAVTDKAKIIAAIDGLSTSGGTNGEGGIRRAYELAEKAQSQYSESRVIMCTDGDFNLGVTGDELVKLVSDERSKGVTLTTLGFGEGNYNDRDMEALADRGNGNYAFIDSEAEADRVLVQKLTSTIQTIAKDVKIQLTLSPTFVSRYRLIGYENRVMANEDFADDTKDGGEIGAGHTVTAFYEVELTEAGKSGQAEGELAKVDLRYKEPQGDVSTEFATTLAPAQVAKSFDDAPADLRFAAGVIELAEILRLSKHSQGARFDDVIAITNGLAGSDPDRVQFVGLAGRAKALWR